MHSMSCAMHIVSNVIYMLTTFSHVIMINWVRCQFSDYILTLIFSKMLHLLKILFRQFGCHTWDIVVYSGIWHQALCIVHGKIKIVHVSIFRNTDDRDYIFSATSTRLQSLSFIPVMINNVGNNICYLLCLVRCYFFHI